MHVYEVRPRKDHRGVDLISDALPFGRLWYDTPDNAIGYAEHYSPAIGDLRTLFTFSEAGRSTPTPRPRPTPAPRP